MHACRLMHALIPACITNLWCRCMHALCPMGCMHGTLPEWAETHAPPGPCMRGIVPTGLHAGDGTGASFQALPIKVDDAGACATTHMYCDEAVPACCSPHPGPPCNWNDNSRLAHKGVSCLLQLCASLQRAVTISFCRLIDYPLLHVSATPRLIASRGFFLRPSSAHHTGWSLLA